jgi:hypothetical protein
MAIKKGKKKAQKVKKQAAQPGEVSDVELDGVSGGVTWLSAPWSSNQTPWSSSQELTNITGDGLLSGQSTWIIKR